MKTTLANLIDPAVEAKLPVLFSLVKAENKSKKFYSKGERRIYIDQIESYSFAYRFHKPISKFPIKNESDI